MKISKLKCVISYDGTNFAGFQVQPQKRTVQGEIEKAISRIHKGKHIQIHSSGRTDKGVHAKAQVFHFETDIQMDLYNWKKALNTLLPNDIFIHDIEEVPLTFHSRYNAIEKEYRYLIINGEEIDVFKRNYVHFNRFGLNMDDVHEACSRFEGTHDFTSFCSARSSVKGSKVRTLYEVSCKEEDDAITFTFRGDGFLRNMVRIIVGVLLDVGQGKMSPNDIDDIFTKKNRIHVGETIPPQGLYLWNVTYESEFSPDY